MGNVAGRGDDVRRSLPSVDHLLRADGVAPWVERFGRVAVAEAIRQSLAEARAAISTPSPGPGELLGRASEILEGSARRRLRRVLNGTGVVLHTNLGRAPLAPSVLASVVEVASGYSNLEYDLEEGRRGDRYAHCVKLVRSLTDSEDALVVNNNAAAVALTVSSLAGGRDVIVSRGELVEIGGSFRLPEVIERAGGFLVEVGTTNRTRIEDYERVITPSTGLLLKVHASNYRVVGFAEETPLDELAHLSDRTGIPLAHDLGSGQLLAPAGESLAPEPHPRSSVEVGADLTMWSGDKLLGGPQAGIIHGSAAAVARLRANPLLRVLRVDKMTLAALEGTLRVYLDPDAAAAQLPVLRMLGETEESIGGRSRETRKALSPAVRKRVRIVPLRSVVGGGTLPDVEIASAGWRIESEHPDRVAAKCRADDPALVGRIEDGAFVVDFRTVAPGEEAAVAQIVERALRSVAGSVEGTDGGAV